MALVEALELLHCCRVQPLDHCDNKVNRMVEIAPADNSIVAVEVTHRDRDVDGWCAAMGTLHLSTVIVAVNAQLLRRAKL